MGCERGQNLPHAHQRSMSGPFPLSWWCSEEAGEAEKGDARIVGVATPSCARLIASRASSCKPGVVFPAARSVVTNCAFFLASALMNSSGWCSPPWVHPRVRGALVGGASLPGHEHHLLPPLMLGELVCVIPVSNLCDPVGALVQDVHCRCGVIGHLMRDVSGWKSRKPSGLSWATSSPWRSVIPLSTLDFPAAACPPNKSGWGALLGPRA